eukprot:2191344-Rhodomonas_salina.4
MVKRGKERGSSVEHTMTADAASWSVAGKPSCISARIPIMVFTAPPFQMHCVKTIRKKLALVRMIYMWGCRQVKIFHPSRAQAGGGSSRGEFPPPAREGSDALCEQSVGNDDGVCIDRQG